jgi:hypothetical protein
MIDHYSGEYYTGNMAIAIEFNPSAFKHGISEEDIQTAIERFVYNELDEIPTQLFLSKKPHYFIQICL